MVGRRGRPGSEAPIRLHHNGLVGGSNPPPGPPRSLSFAEISSRLANSRELAGSAARVRVSAATNDSEQAFSAELSQRALTRPFGRQVAEAGNSHTVGESPIERAPTDATDAAR